VLERIKNQASMPIPKTRLSFLFGALIAVKFMLLFPITSLLVVGIIGNETYFWTVVIGGALYIVSLITIGIVGAIMGKIHIAFPLIAFFVGVVNMMMIAVALILYIGLPF